MPSLSLRLRLSLFSVSLILFAGAALAANPASVTVAGSLQSELGCSGDWQPDCSATHLGYDPEDDVWQGAFNVPAGSYEYKAPLNDSWIENYGLHAQRDGANIPLNLGADASVKFYYDHKTHWITDNHNSIIATAPGSYQSEIGCGGDWDPSCLQSWLEDPDGDGIYTFSAFIPAGNYEVKVAINESWSENYGAGGVPNGANIAFNVAAECTKTQFRYDASTHILTIAPAAADPQPSAVTIAGSLQSELGCPNDWQPDCANTHLTYDATDGVWQGTFSVPAGNFEYKAPLNDSWDENYGANAQRDGANIPLNLGAATSVKFYYDHETHWVTDNHTSAIATAPGSYQHFLGCGGDWQPDCLQSWLEDPDGDGIYTFSTRALPAGDYEAKVTINESWDLNYGAGGVQNGPNISFTVPASCAEIFFVYNASTHVMTVSASGAPQGNLNKAQAHWVTRDLIAWNPSNANVTLHYAPNGGLALGSDGVSGGTDVPLTLDPAGLPAAVRENYPHLAGLATFRLPAGVDVSAALKSQLAVSAKAGDGSLVDATSLQIPGALDDLYTYDGPLGATFASGLPTLRLWAPTARSVSLQLFNDSNPSTTPTVVPMTVDPATGVWTANGSPAWAGKFYLYDVEVFVRGTGHVEHNVVTDPYSLSLARNSARGQIVDLSSAALKPAGWDALSKPRLDAPEDIALYELHVRDFSANDSSLPAVQRGTFKAFTNPATTGMRHLAGLSAAGLTHVHLLPSFDIATIDEDKSHWQWPGDLSGFPPDSDQQQAAVMSVADRDGFNWGYDPWHYTVPEGSYATDADGTTRIVEFREMVQGLSGIGLRTVMDVVYNHTNAAGQNDHSVLDKIVPGYYHRLDGDGNITTSSCCPNTASEHNMMEKLLIDSALTWAKQYKVDGFRFDLMGHHMKRNMTKLRAALDALTPAADGVDGKEIYLYGEGWNFGEVADNARGVNAIQRNMAGTGIGTFTDRLRDGVRGGGPFNDVREQGFISGLYTDPNGYPQGSSNDQKQRLLLQTDWIRLGMAGNLKDFTFVDRYGNTIRGDQLDYNGQQAGYAADPQEIINYIEAHDNETLFDALQFKLPAALSMVQRVRAHNLGLSIVALSQGVPFFHAGTEMLRSKSGDRNSYNSGDWFNKLDFTYAANNWAVGLPPRPDNGSNWDILRPLLRDPALNPSRSDIMDAVAHMREVLAIRKSTGLFRLRSGADVINRVQVLNGGPDPVAGLIIVVCRDGDGSVDRQHSLVASLFNAAPMTQSYTVPMLAGHNLELHPIQMASRDGIVKTSSFSMGTFSVPGRTAAVFWERRPLDAQIALLEGDVDRLAGGSNSLKSKLEAAIDAFRRGNMKAAANQLGAFANEVDAMQRSGRLSAESAAWMRSQAAIIQGEIAE